jgi:heat shock protein HslJ
VRRFLVLLAVGLLAAACSEAAASDVTEDDLNGRMFVSTEVVGRDLIPGTHVQVMFDGGGLTFASGCNDSSGSFGMDGGRVDLEDGYFTTTGACFGPGHPMAQERWVRTFLEDHPVAELSGDRLTLTRGGDVIRLGAVSPDFIGVPNLDGRSFRITEVEGQPTTSQVTERTFEFADGRLTVGIGCAGTTGTVAFNRGHLLLTNAMTQASACMDDDGNVEDGDAWLADFVLGQPLIWLDGNTLHLWGDGVEVTAVD